MVPFYALSDFAVGYFTASSGYSPADGPLKWWCVTVTFWALWIDALMCHFLRGLHTSSLPFNFR